MTFHDDVLAPRQKRALRLLGPLMSRQAFYLAGGTAIALHLGHRRSVDLDWFTGNRVPDMLLLARAIRDEGVPLGVRQIERGTIHGEIGRVPVTLLEYRYPLLQGLGQWRAYGCAVAALDDLACMKLSAITQRGAKKDFVDIYALGSRHKPLAELLSAYQRKYAIREVSHVLYALAYFDDADRERMPKMLWDLDWRTIKRAIQGWIREFVGSR